MNSVPPIIALVTNHLVATRLLSVPFLFCTSGNLTDKQERFLLAAHSFYKPFSPPLFKTTFAQWVKELKTAFAPYGWELTAAVAGGKSTIDAGYDVPELSKYLDAIHLMTYDFHGSWESTVDHHAPLYPRASNDYLAADYA